MYQNYYNPYQYYMPRMSRMGFSTVRPHLKTNFNFSEILNGTQKTLNIINQAIPIFYQIRPIWNNVRTMFRVVGALREEDDGPRDSKPNTKDDHGQESAHAQMPSNPSTVIHSHNQPQFFV